MTFVAGDSDQGVVFQCGGEDALPIDQLHGETTATSAPSINVMAQLWMNFTSLDSRSPLAEG
jgi:hypothetical protein